MWPPSVSPPLPVVCPVQRYLIKALNQQANISSATTTNTVTTNMVPAPLQIAKETTYLAKTSTTTSDSYSSTELEPGTITTGLFDDSAAVYPRQRHHTVADEFQPGDDPTITTVSAKDGSTSIQTPTTDVRSLTQRANLKPGQTLVLNGFQSLYNEANRQGTTSKAGSASEEGKVLSVTVPCCSYSRDPGTLIMR